jgi:hypothetical protein
LILALAPISRVLIRSIYPLLTTPWEITPLGMVVGYQIQATYAANIGTQNVAQNSWNVEFFNNGPFDTFDPNLDGTYDFVLTAFSKGTTDVLAQSKIQIIVGAGADDDTQPVPEPATALALLGFGLAHG